MPDTRIASMQPLTGASFAFQSINRANPKAIFSTIHPPFRTLFSDFTHLSIYHTFNPNSPSCAWACACEERFRLHMTTQSKPLERCGALRRRAARGLFCKKRSEIRKILTKICWIFCRILQKYVDCEKCWKMLYWMQKIMKISLKFDEILTKF